MQSETEALKQEVKTLTLRIWEFEKRLREIEESKREIKRTKEFLRSIFGYEEPEEDETDIERIAAKYSDELERLADR